MCGESMPETEFGMPGMTQIMARPACTPSITSEQIIDDRHGKNPCMLTNIENVAEMSSVAESCSRGGFKIQNFVTWMREFSVNSM